MRESKMIDLQSFPNELRLLLAIMSLEHHPAAIEEIKARAQTAEWPKFLEFVKHHRVHAIVYHKVKTYNLREIPELVQRALWTDYRVNMFKMLQLAGHLEELCQAFAHAGIRTLVLKGPSLALELYDDLALRTSKDLDLLIAIDDLEHAERLLTGLGFVVKTFVPRIFNDWKWRAHHISFYHPAKRLEVELHWRMQPNFGKEPSFDELWIRRNQSQAKLKSVDSLSSVDQLIYLSIHGARHGWFRLRWILDISQLSRQLTAADYESIHAVSKQLQSVSLIGQALILAQSLLHTPFPETCERIIEQRRAQRYAEFATTFIRQMIQLHPIPETPQIRRMYKKYIIMLLTTRQKLFYFLSSLYPNSWDATEFPLPKVLSFLYVPLRPLFWLYRRSGWKEHVKQDGVKASQ